MMKFCYFLRHKIFSKLGRKGQATTEVVLLFPIFFILAIFIIKVYGLLIVVQKAEIASAYAGRRWQLESHKAPQYLQWDRNVLQANIKKQISEYIGFNNPYTKKFLSLRKFDLKIERTQAWNILTLTISTYPPRISLICLYDKRDICKYPYGEACMKGYNFMCESGGSIKVTKQVLNRDRPLPYIHIMSRAKQ